MKFALMTKFCAALLLLQMGLAAQAGRPLSTEDASTAGANKCQVESWLEREATDATRTLAIAPACGLGDAVEVSVQLARTLSDNGIRSESTLYVKWVDPSWTAGTLNWGAKAWHGLAYARQSPAWSATSSGAMGLLTWKASQDVDLHANLGAVRDHASHSTEPMANLAISWAPAPAVTLIAEALAVRHGATQRNIGARWWLLPERFALDVSTGRSTGANAARTTTVGVGWYGIGW